MVTWLPLAVVNRFLNAFVGKNDAPAPNTSVEAATVGMSHLAIFFQPGKSVDPLITPVVTTPAAPAPTTKAPIHQYSNKVLSE